MEIGNIEKLTPEHYPKQLAALREIPDPPKELWLRGNLPKDGTKLLAVVGSRALTRYGREATELLLGGLAGYPISIISGLALGADAAAHHTALSSGLHTIAIPGGGPDDDSIGPRSNLGLAHRILESGGAILSEHEPGYLAHPFDFPSRNRIMVGLADAVLIIEAGPKSGTLITARLAGEYNRHLLCVPHRIGDPHGFGAHLFLREGATVVTGSSHILEALQLEVREERSLSESIVASIFPNLTPNERRVYEVLENPLPRDEFVRAITLPTHEALTVLISLEFKGLVKEEFGMWKRV